MKKIFFVAIAATLLAAGCQKTEVINQVTPDGTSMTFAPGMGKLTKAATNPSATGLQTLQKQSFRLWAYYVAADPNRGAAANTIYDGMENINVTFSGEDWFTSPVHFWPGKDKKLKFFAISADSDTYGDEKSSTTTTTEGVKKTKVSITTNDNGGTLKVTGFEVDNTNPNVDLMIADYVEAAQSGSEGYTSNNVDLTFRHALAKVEFWFANASAPAKDPEKDLNKVIVQSMYVDNVVKKGDVTIQKQSATLTPSAWAQSTESTDKVRFSGDDYEKDSNLSVPALADIEQAENIEQFVGTGNGKEHVPTGHEMLLKQAAQKYTTWLVIPQTVGESKEDTNGLKVVIAYLIGDRQFVATFPLYASNAGSWDPNQYIKYNISLSPNMIGFNPSVEEWETTSGNGGSVEIN